MIVLSPLGLVKAERIEFQSLVLFISFFAEIAGAVIERLWPFVGEVGTDVTSPFVDVKLRLSVDLGLGS